MQLKTRQRTVTTTLEPATESAALSWADWQAPTLGTLWLQWSDRGLHSLDFAHAKLSLSAEHRRTLPAQLHNALQRYFSGEPESFENITLDLQGTDFQKRVWNALREIPYGHVASYGHIANVLGIPRGMRAVGMANGRNPIPIIVPCHRVIEHSGKLGGFTSGLETKRHLLQLEGAQLRDDHVYARQLGLFS